MFLETIRRRSDLARWVLGVAAFDNKAELRDADKLSKADRDARRDEAADELAVGLRSQLFQKFTLPPCSEENKAYIPLRGGVKKAVPPYPYFLHLCQNVNSS